MQREAIQPTEGLWMNKRKTKLSWQHIFVASVITVLLALGGYPRVSAQSPGDGWMTPANLSNSGSASNPIMFVTADGRIHVIWNDTFEGVVYTSGDGVQWDAPEPIKPPWASKQKVYTPALVASPEGLIYAIWIDANSGLEISQVAADRFKEAGAWSTARTLTDSALAFAASIDETGTVHLVYLRAIETQDAPAGIYYMNFPNGGKSWTTPVSLYVSPYFRGLKPESARLQLSATAADGVQRVFVVWDNPARERVFITRSVDGGQTWDAAQEVDTPLDGSVTGGPSKIAIGAQGSDVLLMWQSENTGTVCSQNFQWSQDGGTTWTPKQQVLEDVPGCPEENQIFMGKDYVFLLSSVHQQMYLLAWNGNAWSSPRPQVTLSSFVDPATFKSVSFSCRTGALVGGNTLYVVGCDAGSGQDIWITSRVLDQVDKWYTDKPVWQQPTALVSEPIPLRSPVLIADNENRIHAFWSQPDGSNTSGAGTTIYYARLDNGQWSSPVAILNSGEGIADEPAAAVDDQGVMYIAWSGGGRGEIYFSEAEAARAVIGSAWSTPVRLPSSQVAGSAPDILVDQKGTVYVVYAIPLNEGRGIYLTRSEDEGKTWSPPVTVFDAAAAGWSMVDKPHLALTGNGHLHIIWTRYSLPSGSGSQGLYYARSSDGGATWSQPETVVDQPVIWSRLLGTGERTINRVWQEVGSDRTTLWHEVSQDSGVTWTRIAPVSIFGNTVGEPGLAQDPAGRLHLLQMVDRGQGSFSLQHWVWDGSVWSSDQGVELINWNTTGMQYISMAVARNGILGVMFDGNTTNPQTGEMQDNLFFTYETLQLPADVPTPLPPLTATPTLQPTTTPTPGPTPTATITSGFRSSAGIVQGPGGDSSSVLSSIAGPFVAGLIVLIVFVVSLRRYGLNRR